MGHTFIELNLVSEWLICSWPERHALDTLECGIGLYSSWSNNNTKTSNCSDFLVLAVLLRTKFWCMIPKTNFYLPSPFSPRAASSSESFEVPSGVGAGLGPQQPPPHHLASLGEVGVLPVVAFPQDRNSRILMFDVVAPLAPVLPIICGQSLQPCKH